MSAFRFHPVTPHPLLQPYIDKMWVFQSSGRLPALDKKMIVPNANLKLAFTSRNGLVARVDDKTIVQKENTLSLTGLVDSSVMLDPLEDTSTDTIVIEFNPNGAYRLFHLSYVAVKNQIVAVADLMGRTAEVLEQQLAEAKNTALKVKLLQNFLLKQLDKATPDTIFDYCVDRISHSKGLISVARLEKETGYSARWLHKKFLEHLGTGPKKLADIVRFRQFYQAYSTGANLKELMYAYYYDQSHFLRAFKRFTGSTPTDLQNSVNELATKHYTS